MTYRIAIAISGAVSLGSYEAGTLYEIINAIKLHNNHPENERIEIDVLTGASAGGMTAALVAQKLMFEGAELDDPENNVGYQAWVEKVDIKGLLDHHPGDKPNTAILSSGFVERIANDLILSRYQQTEPQKSDTQPVLKKLELAWPCLT